MNIPHLPAANQRAEHGVSFDGNRFNETTGDRLVEATAARRAYAEHAGGLSAANQDAARTGPLPKDFLSALLAQTARPGSPAAAALPTEPSLSHPMQMSPLPTARQWALHGVSVDGTRPNEMTGDRLVEATAARRAYADHSAQLAAANQDAAWAGSLTSNILSQLFKGPPRATA